MFVLCVCFLFFFKQKTAYEMRISDWSSDVCSSDLYWLIRPPPACVKCTTSTSSLLANIALGGRIRKRTEPPIPATRTNRDGIRRGPAAFVAYQIGRASCRERVCQYV